jgi:hypothetical protein
MHMYFRTQEFSYAYISIEDIKNGMTLANAHARTHKYVSSIIFTAMVLNYLASQY